MEMVDGPLAKGFQGRLAIKGLKTSKPLSRECYNLGVSTVTLYAFSTENWKRPVYEVKALMSLFKYYLNKKLT